MAEFEKQDVYLGTQPEVKRKKVLKVGAPDPLVVGSIYRCTVKEVIKPNELLVCGMADGSGRDMPGQCISATGLFGSLLGFKLGWIPPRGTKCLVLYTGENLHYILGTYGNSDEGDTKGLGRSATSPDKPDEGGIKPYGLSKAFEWFRSTFLRGDSDQPNNMYNFGYKPDWSQVEGEIDIGNQLGVALNLSRHMASIRGGELAKVECHLVDDMVRMVSQTFKHFNAFGDYKIYNDGGRLNVRWDGTNVDWETYGNSDRKTPRGDLDSEETNVMSPTSQNMENDAKWRFSQFVGFLGDFINIFVTDPIETEKTHPHVKHNKRSGKGRVHINEDGSVLIQTVSEVGIEKVCRIPVPLEQYPEYHPDGDVISEEWEGELPNLDPLKIWDFEQSGGIENAHFNIYQIRSYVKWFSNKYSKAQFLRLNKDWKVPSEKEVPEPDVLGQNQEDKLLANEGMQTPTIDAYATVRIQKDGSILILDAYDNSIVMSKGGLQLSSTNNVQIEAAGSINMLAGRDINMSAKNNLDLVAVQKGISIRSNTFFQQYCQNGGILFETDQVSEKNIYESEDNPLADHEDTDRVEGIYFKTNYSSVRVEAGRDIGLKTKQGSILATPAKDFAVSTGSRFQVNDTMEIPNTKTRSATDFDINKPFKDTDNEDNDSSNDGLGVVKVDGMCIIAKTFTNYLVQYADNYRPMLCDCSPDKGIPTSCVVNMKTGKWKKKQKSPFCHPGHVLTTRQKMFDTVIGDTDALKYKKHTSTGKFSHRSAEEYGTTGSKDPQSSEALYQTVTQQALHSDLQNKALVKTEYATWNYTAEASLNDRGAPWPGLSVKQLIFDRVSSKLWEPDSTDPSDYNNYADALTPGDLVIKNIKENS